MTRAKHRAGIPVNEAPKPSTKKPSVKRLQKEGRGWQATNQLNKQPNEVEKRSQLQSRLQNLQFRKPAGNSI